jgi:universal stress protein A
MFQRIVVPVDLTDKHQQAIDLAAQLISAGGGEVVVLHVIELLHGLSREEGRDFYQRLERVAQERLQPLVRSLGDRRIRARQEILYGERAQEVLRYCQENSIDLIVLTSHRIGPANPTAGWGTLSYKIGILAQCPVLLVK